MRLNPSPLREQFWKQRFWNGFGDVVPDPTLWEAVKGFVLDLTLQYLASRTFYNIVKHGFVACIAFLVFLRVFRFCVQYVVPLFS